MIQIILAPINLPKFLPKTVPVALHPIAGGNQPNSRLHFTQPTVASAGIYLRKHNILPNEKYSASLPDTNEFAYLCSESSCERKIPLSTVGNFNRKS